MSENSSQENTVHPDELDIDALQLALSTAQKEAEQAKKEVEKNKDAYVRLQAELQNIERRNRKTVEQTRDYAISNFALELLRVADSLEQGLKSELDASSERTGLELTLKLVLSIFESFDIKKIEALSLSFDPQRHEAVGAQPSETPEGTVLEVFQSGYTLKDRVLRPARVLVSKGPLEKNESGLTS